MLKASVSWFAVDLLHGGIRPAAASARRLGAPLGKRLTCEHNSPGPRHVSAGSVLPGLERHIHQISGAASSSASPLPVQCGRSVRPTHQRTRTPLAANPKGLVISWYRPLMLSCAVWPSARHMAANLDTSDSRTLGQTPGRASLRPPSTPPFPHHTHQVPRNHRRPRRPGLYNGTWTANDRHS